MAVGQAACTFEAACAWQTVGCTSFMLCKQLLEVPVPPSATYVAEPVGASRAAGQAPCPPALPAGELAGVLAAAACGLGGDLKVSCSSKALLLGSAASSPRPYTLHSRGPDSAGDCRGVRRLRDPPTSMPCPTGEQPCGCHNQCSHSRSSSRSNGLAGAPQWLLEG